MKMKNHSSETYEPWVLLKQSRPSESFLFFLFLIITHTLTAQDSQLVKGMVVDASSLQPVPYVHLQIKHTSLGTVANQEGAFSFLLQKSFSGDTLLVSSIGYASLELSIAEVMAKDTFYLKETAINLDPILITSLTAEDIVRKSIQSIPKNYPHADNYFTGFYRTAIKECQTFVRLLEGPVRVMDPGYVSKDTAAVVYLNVKESEDYRAYKLEEKYLLEDALTFEHIRLRSGFLNPSTLDGWKYDMVGYTQYDSKGVMIIGASYISDKNKMNHSAKIYIDDTSFAIYKVEYKYHWLDAYYKKSPIDSLSEAEHKWEGEFHYAYGNEEFYLKYFVFHHTKSLYDSMYKRKVCDVEVYSEFQTYEIANREGEEVDSKRMFSDFEYTFEPAKPIETALYRSIVKDLDSLAQNHTLPLPY